MRGERVFSKTFNHSKSEQRIITKKLILSLKEDITRVKLLPKDDDLVEVVENLYLSIKILKKKLQWEG